MNTTYAYGSADAIKIVTAMQRENYIIADMQSEERKEKSVTYRLMSFYILLSSQVKADLTDVFISPVYWFKMKTTDFDTDKDVIARECNKIVDELGISKAFMIKC